MRRAVAHVLFGYPDTLKRLCAQRRLGAHLGIFGCAQGGPEGFRREKAPISSSLGTSNTQRWWDSRTDEREDQPFDHERHLSAHKKCSHGRIWRQIERHRSVPGGASSYLWVFEAPKDFEICRVLGGVERLAPE